MMHHRHQQQNSPWLEILASLQETGNELFREHPQFQYRGKTYTVRSSGRRALSLLRNWKKVMGDEARSSLLLREEIRRVGSSPPPMLLSYLLKRASDPFTVRLILLIVRRGKVHAAVKPVFARYEHSNQRLRRDVVRTLRQLSAWRELRVVASKCSFADTRKLAASIERPPFQKRLQNFARISRAQIQQSDRQELVVASEVDFTSGRPARTGSQIAWVLRSIRRLISQTRHRRRSFFHRHLR